ncbi:MAG: prolyl oligopeptidase family serine peptidase [Candidatus Hydrogenedentes bacterium]|nr:prolyl oligopeptidase family serine peptidase [Candidatus Hydrogenedentota bacterium]
MKGRIVLCLVMATTAAFADDAGVRESTQFGAKRLDFTVDGAPGFVIEPPVRKFDKNHPWVWYAPTFLGRHPDPSHEWYFKPLLDAGFYIAGVEVGESFGSPDGVAAYQAFHTHVVAAYNLSIRPVLLPQSRGGLMLYNWAVAHPESVGAVAGIYTVCSFTSYPGVEKAAPAYGLSAADLEARRADFEPIERLAPLARAGVPVFHIHGDADAVVPVEENAGKLVARYRNLGGTATLKLVAGKGHEVCDEFFKDPEFLAFMLEHGGRARHDE